MISDWDRSLSVPVVGRIGVLRDPQGATVGIINPGPAS
jgi:hypothetical protein